MKIEIRKFRIGTLAEKLNVEKFVIRFWEKEFNIKSNRSSGKQRFYSESDFQKFATIKELLYDQGLTIAGAKKQFKAKPTTSKSSIVASHITTMEPEIGGQSAEKTIVTHTITVTDQMLELHKKLIRLRELL